MKISKEGKPSLLIFIYLSPLSKLKNTQGEPMYSPFSRDATYTGQTQCQPCIRKHTTFYSPYHAVNPIPRYILQFFFAGLCKTKAAFTSSAFTMR